MFGWFGNRREDDGFRPSERRIYSYFNGERTIRADPLILWTKIMDVGPDLAGDIAVATSPRTTAPEMKRKVVARLRTIFGLKPLTESITGVFEVVDTLSDQEVCDLMCHFMDWAESLKKNSAAHSTSSNTATGTHGNPSLDAVEFPTGNTPAFGSTASGNGTGGSAPSATGSPPVSAQSH